MKNFSHALRRGFSGISGFSGAAALALSLLLATDGAWAQVPAMTGSRSTSFTYQPNGMLQSETVEPGSPNLCVASTHSYDAYGNRVGGSSANCQGATGDALFTTLSSGTVTYAAQTVSVKVAGVATSISSPAGIFATVVTNALGHQEERTYAPRFGALLTLNGPNDLVTQVEVDDSARCAKSGPTASAT